MMETTSIIEKIVERYGNTIDLRKNPEILDEIVNEVKKICQTDLTEFNRITQPLPPVGVSWMDSWAAHWVVSPQNLPDPSTEKEFESVVKGLVDQKFKDRLSEIKRFIDLRSNEPPDGGPPEPGVPNPPEPPGPSPIFAPPDGGTPEPGVPNPPEPPGPAGIDPGLTGENPWILYWFVSLKAPLILEMIDAHFTRRINELAEQKS